MRTLRVLKLCEGLAQPINHVSDPSDGSVRREPNTLTVAPNLLNKYSAQRAVSERRRRVELSVPAPPCGDRVQSLQRVSSASSVGGTVLMKV